MQQDVHQPIRKNFTSGLRGVGTEDISTIWNPSRVPGTPDLELDAVRTRVVLHPL